MPPTLITEVLAPHWATLTSDQQIAWAFYGNTASHLTQRGANWALHSFQAFVQTNALLATIDAAYILDDPPTDATPPDTVRLTLMNLPHRSRTSWDLTKYPGWIYLELDRPMPSNAAAIIRTAYRGEILTTGRVISGNHVTVIKPTETGPINLQTPRGFYATSAGATPRARITGAGALRRDRRASLLVDFVSLTTARLTTRQVAAAHYR